MPETAAAVLETPATTTPPAAAATATPPPAVPPPATPPAAATPAAETEPARTAAEPAKAPEKYTLTLPAESPFVDADLAVFSAQAKALALTNDQAQALVNGHVETVRTLSAQYLAEAQADPEIGGTKFAETTALAIKGLDWLFPADVPGTADVKALLNKTGLGNHKALIRAFARIGRAKQEDTAVAGTTTHSATKKDPADVLYGGGTSA